MSDDELWVLWLAENPHDMEDYAAEGESFREAVERTTAFHLWRLARQYEVTVRQVPIIGPVLFRRARRTTEGLRSDFAAHNAKHLARALEADQ